MSPLLGLSIDDTLGKLLMATIDKLKIKKSERSNASSCVNNITAKVVTHLKQNVNWCKDIERLRTGSYYENVKICEPDEFDVMRSIPVDVALKRHPNKHALHRFLNEDKTIQASEMLSEFRDAVKEAVQKLPCRSKQTCIKKKPRCPAVTLEVKMEENGKTISIDFVLGLKVHRASWPDFTKDGFKIETWLGKKEKANMKHRPFYLVSKYEGKGHTDAWRISFSHVEKEILKRHGHSKTCCEDVGYKCCQYLFSQRGRLQIQEDVQILLLSCKDHPSPCVCYKGNRQQVAYSQLAICFQQLLEDFVQHLRKCHLPNFFIPSHNLLRQASPSSCDFLANEIEFQLNNNFLIFS
uniref:Cyclic GMP-AMP synthase n=1 Tax=Sinocyclocheilus grahami TaxID=75366 RepID=A0A672NW96_SINGR